MLGDLVGWLNSINFTSYDRIGRYGHFTLYRNTPQITELWKNKVDGSITVDRVLRTTFPCYFDESGMNQICEASGIKFFSYNHVANVEALENLHFKTKEKLCQLFVWENGQTFIYSRKDGKIIISIELMSILGNMEGMIIMKSIIYSISRNMVNGRLIGIRDFSLK